MRATRSPSRPRHGTAPASALRGAVSRRGARGLQVCAASWTLGVSVTSVRSFVGDRVGRIREHRHDAGAREQSSRSIHEQRPAGGGAGGAAGPQTISAASYPRAAARRRRPRAIQSVASTSSGPPAAVPARARPFPPVRSDQPPYPSRRRHESRPLTRANDHLGRIDEKSEPGRYGLCGHRRETSDAARALRRPTIDGGDPTTPDGRRPAPPTTATGRRHGHGRRPTPDGRGPGVAYTPLAIPARGPR